MRIHPARFGIVSAILAAISSSTLAAQNHFELGPTVGAFAPLGSFRAQSFYSSGLPLTPEDLTGLNLGVQGRLWTRSQFGFQIDGGVALSRVGGGGTPIGVSASYPARIFTGSAQLLYRITSAEAPVRLWFSGGAGVVQYGGRAYSTFTGRTRPAGVFGIATAILLHPGLDLNVGLSGFVYGLDLRDTSVPGLQQGGNQLDARLQTGISWAWR